MKKKFSLILNIATICLCVCAIAIGVWSAKNAQLAVSGSVGFQANHCNVDATIAFTGMATTEGGEVSQTPVNVLDDATDSANLQIRGQDMSASFADIYFTDMPSYDNAQPITMTFSFTNQSNFEVDVFITLPTITNVSYTKDSVAVENNQVYTKLGTAQGKTQKTIAIVLNLSESATGLTKAEYSFGVEFKQSPLKVIDDLYWGAWIEEVYDDNGEEVIDHNYGLVERPAIVLDLGYDQNTKPIRWFAYKYDRNGDGVPETPTDNLSRSQLLNLLQTDTTYAFISYEHTFEVDYGTFENFDPMEESTWPTYLDSDAKTYFDEFRTNYNIPTQGSLYQKQILPTIVGEEDGNNVYQKITPHYYAQVHLEHSNDADEWVIGPNGDSGESHVWSVDMGGEDNYQICTYYFEWHAEELYFSAQYSAWGTLDTSAPWRGSFMFLG